MRNKPALADSTAGAGKKGLHDSACRNSRGYCGVCSAHLIRAVMSGAAVRTPKREVPSPVSRYEEYLRTEMKIRLRIRSEEPPPVYRKRPINAE